MCGLFTPSRWARPAICSSPSSPEIYSTGVSLLAHQWASSSVSVDFPMPGSPDRSVRLPRTSPPPRTPESSGLFTASRMWEVERGLSVTTSFFFPITFFWDPLLIDKVASCFSSVFQVLQLGHCHDHLSWVWEHWVQRNIGKIVLFNKVLSLTITADLLYKKKGDYIRVRIRKELSWKKETTLTIPSVA